MGQPQEPRIGYHTIDGLKIRYFDRPGADDHPPLLICNGLGQAFEILFPLMDELPARRIIAFDAAGVGRSDVPDTMLSIENHADIVAKLMDQLEIPTYDILGISWGGSVAQQMAHDHPTRCRRLILAITSAGGIGSWWGTPLALSEIVMPLRYSSREYGNFIGPFMYGGEAVLNPQLFRDYAKNSIKPDYQGYFGQVRAMCSWTSLGWLRTLTQPTQVIAGLFDGLIPIANQLLLANTIPNAQLKIYNAGHLLMYSERESVGTLITDFLDRENA